MHNHTGPGPPSGNERPKRGLGARSRWASDGGVIFTEREQSIIRCEADDVTATEVKRLLPRMQRAGMALVAIGAVRIRYDHLIDDGEKAVRQFLGLEKDYSHKLTLCDAHKRTGARPYALIDGIPLYIWCLLHLPEKALKTKAEITIALAWCLTNNRLEEHKKIQTQYGDIIAERPAPPPALSIYESSLVDGRVDFPSGKRATNLLSSIHRMEKKGFVEEAGIVRRFYSFILNPPPQLTPFARRLLEAETLTPHQRGNIPTALRRMERDGFLAEAAAVRQAYDHLLNPAPQLTPFEKLIVRGDELSPHQKAHLRSAARRMEQKGFLEEAEIARQRHAHLLNQSPELTPFALRLLNSPEDPNINPWHLRAAIRRMAASGFHDEAAYVNQLYGGVFLEELYEPIQLGFFLLEEDEFVPNSRKLVDRAIQAMMDAGYWDEAAELNEKYAWFLGNENFWRQDRTPEEVNARFNALLAQFR